MTVTDYGATTYLWNSDSRLQSVTTPDAESASYQYNGSPTKMTHANATFADYTYTNRSFLQSVVNKKSDLSVISSFTYTLDSVGNRTRVDEDTGEYVLYGYDNTYQLTSETRKDNLRATLFSATYEYDAVGNRTRMVKDAAETLYTYNNMNQMLTGGNVSFTFDANGNLTSKAENNDTTTYTWDYENKLTQITYPDLTTNTFAYNGDGLRVQKTDSQGTLKFIYDGTRYASPLIAATNAADQIQVNYDYGLVLVRQKTAAGARSYHHFDGLGSTSRMSDPAEAVTDSFKYEAWGDLVSRSGTTNTPFQFVGSHGYYSDKDSGLMMLGARYYTPATGRFLAIDPIEEGINWYAYCRNAPLNHIDPTGNWLGWLLAVLVIGGVAVAMVVMALRKTMPGKPTFRPIDPPWLANANCVGWGHELAAGVKYCIYKCAVGRGQPKRTYRASVRFSTSCPKGFRTDANGRPPADPWRSET